MIHRYFFVAVMSMCFLVNSTSADMLTVNTDAPTGSPLVINPGTVSDPLVVSVTNNTNSDNVDDQLNGWEVTLEIVPDPGATGALTFNSNTNPANYIFNGLAHTNIPGSLNTDTRLQMSGASFAGAVQVPTSPGSGLLKITFAASLNASGTFGIFVVDGTASQWSDNANPVMAQRDYENVPTNGGPVRIGEVSIIPEPSSLIAWGVGVGALNLARRRTRWI